MIDMAVAVRDVEPETHRFYRLAVLNKPVKKLAKQKLLMALRAHGGNKKATARALKISRSNLYQQLERYGISGGDE
jgi:transcriptional regulator of acetoin/glycerol metabolism